MDKDERKKLTRKAKGRGIAVDGEGGYSRHILMCTGAGCCSREAGAATWKALSKQIKALKREGCSVYASQVNCLFFCQRGPLAVVYPEGTWYAFADEAAVEQIAREHLLQGRVVEDLAFACNPLHSETVLEEEAARPEGIPST